MSLDPTTSRPGSRSDAAIASFRLVIAVVVYAALACAVLARAFEDGRVVSASALFAVNGPFPVDFRNRAPEGVGMLSDSMVQFEPWRELQAQRMAEGDFLPLWKDNTYCGAPFFANGQAALLYPPHLLAAWLGHPPDTNFWLAFFHFLLGAVGAYLLLRHLSCGFLGSLLGGAAFGFCAFQAIHVLHPHLRVTATLPWLLLAIDRLVIAPSIARVTAVAAITAWQHLAGHPETTFHVQLVAGALAVVRAMILSGGLSRVLARALWAAAAGIAGAALAAVQIVPFVEYLRESTVYQFRHGDELFGKFALEAIDSMFLIACVAIVGALAGLRRARSIPWIVVFSILLGFSLHYALDWAREEGSVTPPIALLAPDWMGDPNRWKGPDSYWVHVGHFVGPALVLSYLAYLASPRRALVRLGIALLALGVLFGVRSPILSELLEKVPLFSQTVNRKLSFLAPMGGALLSALAVDGAVRAREIRWFVPRFLLGAVAVAVPIVLTIAPFVADEGRGDDVLTQKLSRSVAIEAGAFGFEPAPMTRANGSPDHRAGKVLIHGWARVDAVPTLADIVFRTGERAWVKFDAENAPLDRGTFATEEVPAGARAFCAEMIGAVMSEPLGWYRIRAALPNGRIVHSNWMWSQGTPPLPYSVLAEPYWPISPSAFAQLLWLAVLVAALSVLPFLATRFAGLFAAGVGFVVVAGVALPLARKIVPVLPVSHYYAPSEGCDVLESGRPQARHVSGHVGIFYTEIAAWYGLLEAIGNDAMSPARTERLVETAIHGADAVGLPSHLPPLLRERMDLRLLGLLGVRALVNLPATIEELEPAVGPVLFQIPGTMWLRSNPYWLSRARLVGTSEVIESDEEQYAAVRSAPRRLAEVVILDRGNVFSHEGPNVGTVNFAPGGDQGDRVVLDVEPTTRCHLVLADTHFPGWRAFVDGVERPILRANYAFRAVELREGDRRVVFEYRPLSLRVGIAISLVTVAMLALGCLAFGRFATLRSSAA